MLIRKPRLSCLALVTLFVTSTLGYGGNEETSTQPPITQQTQKTLAYLESLYQPNGGYLPAQKSSKSPKTAVPTLRATASAVRALRYFGADPKVMQHREKTSQFVRSCFDKETGGFADTPGGKPDVVVTAVGLMAVVELKMPRADFEEPGVLFMGKRAGPFEQVRMTAAGLEAVGRATSRNWGWIELLERQANPDGTFGKKGPGQARETASVVPAILRLGGKIPEKQKQKILEMLDQEQRSDGGFGTAESKGSDLETTYRVLRTYKMLGARPKRLKDCEAFVLLCRNEDGGYGLIPNADSGAGPTYFASIILYWLSTKS